MKKFLTVMAAMAFALSVGFVGAQEKGKGGGEKGKGKMDPAKRAEMFLEAADTDGSGTLSKEEVAASRIGEKMQERGEDAIDKFFDMKDKDGDGELSKKELLAGGKGRPDAKGKGGEEGKGKGKAKGGGDEEEEE
ncbi:MAG: EF-hand domain-containing protein [Verrucomicrobiota bacterium]